MNAVRGITANRHRGAETSVAAFERIKGHTERRRYAILLLFRSSRPVLGFTVKEVAGRFGVSPNVVSGRLTELKRDGFLKENGQRREKAAALILTRKGRGA